MNKYLSQRAAPWVSFAVLAGGMMTAVILFFLVRVEASVLEFNSPESEYYIE